jgi:hypothetical protein
MLKQILSSVLATLWLFTSADRCLAKELLFEAEPANNDYARGVGKRLAETYRTEFEPRMFPHGAWHQRLAYSSEDNETLEIYSKPDGSRWLSHRRANASLTGILSRSIVNKEEFDLKKELDAVRITSHEVQLPAEVAIEIEQLWRTMLPGVPHEKVPPILTTHTPIFDAWVRYGHSVEAGRIPMAAYDTPLYRVFVDVIKDLREACHRHARPGDPIFRRLPAKIRDLRRRL